MKQLEDTVCKNARQKKYQSPYQEKAETDAIKLDKEIPEIHLKLFRSTIEQPRVQPRLKTNVIEEKIRKQPTIRASVHRQVVVPNKVILTKIISLKKRASSDIILTKITLSQQAICSSIDQIM